MDVRQLQYFLAVAEEKNFRRAAERLSIAQPSLSQQIRRLERDLQADLFSRNTRSVKLTAAGEALLRSSRVVIADLEEAISLVRHVANGEEGRLRIGFVSSAGIHIVPALVNDLHASFPKLKVKLTEVSTDHQIVMLQQGEIDIGVLRDFEPKPDIELATLFAEHFVLAVHDKHPLARCRSTRLSRFCDTDFITYSAADAHSLRSFTHRLCVTAGFEPHVVQEAMQTPTLLGLVAADIGVALVPATMQVLQLPGVKYIELIDSSVTSTISVAYRKVLRRSPLIMHVIEAILSGERSQSLRERSKVSVTVDSAAAVAARYLRSTV